MIKLSSKILLKINSILFAVSHRPNSYLVYCNVIKLLRQVSRKNRYIMTIFMTVVFAINFLNQNKKVQSMFRITLVKI